MKADTIFAWMILLGIVVPFLMLFFIAPASPEAAASIMFIAFFVVAPVLIFGGLLGMYFHARKTTGFSFRKGVKAFSEPTKWELQEKARREREKKLKAQKAIAAAPTNFMHYAKIAIPIIVAIAILFLVVPMLFPSSENYVQIEGIKFIPPVGWTVDEYPYEDYLAEVSGPMEDNSIPRFNIQRVYYPECSFDKVISNGRETVLYFGATILSERQIHIGGKQAIEFTVRVFLEEEGHYGKGKQISIFDNLTCDVYIVSFGSKETTYPKNVSLFDASMASLQFVG